MKSFSLGPLLFVLCACGSSPAFTQADNSEPAQLQLPLEAVGSHGRLYELRGVLLIRNVDTDASWAETIDGSFRSTRLDMVPGEYEVTLADSWSLLEEVDGILTPVVAQLVSPNPLRITAVAGTQVMVPLRFVLGEVQVAFGDESHVSVEVSVQDTQPLTEALVHCGRGTVCLAGTMTINAPDQLNYHGRHLPFAISFSPYALDFDDPSPLGDWSDLAHETYFDLGEFSDLPAELAHLQEVLPAINDTLLNVGSNDTFYAFNWNSGFSALNHMAIYLTTSIIREFDGTPLFVDTVGPGSGELCIWEDPQFPGGVELCLSLDADNMLILDANR